METVRPDGRVAETGANLRWCRAYLQNPAENR